MKSRTLIHAQTPSLHLHTQNKLRRGLLWLQRQPKKLFLQLVLGDPKDFFNLSLKLLPGLVDLVAQLGPTLCSQNIRPQVGHVLLPEEHLKIPKRRVK